MLEPCEAAAPLCMKLWETNRTKMSCFLAIEHVLPGGPKHSCTGVRAHSEFVL